MLNDCERVIKHGFKSFIEVGAALARIRDSRLYRCGYTTFQEYCRARWELSETRANQLAVAANVTTIVVTAGLPAPSNEWQARELASLRKTPEQLTRVWAAAHERSGGQLLTARVIKEARMEAEAVGHVEIKCSPAASAPPAPLTAQQKRSRRTIIAWCEDIDQLWRLTQKIANASPAMHREALVPELDGRIAALSQIVRSLTPIRDELERIRDAHAGTI